MQEGVTVFWVVTAEEKKDRIKEGKTVVHLSDKGERDREKREIARERERERPVHLALAQNIFHIQWV